jgi:hypothetical protein
MLREERTGLAFRHELARLAKVTCDNYAGDAGGMSY